MKKVVESTKAPEALGPYSQAIEFNNFLFISGQLPIDRETNQIPDQIDEQTTNVLNNIDHILNEAGYGFVNVLKTTCYLSDMKNFKKMNDVYSKYFADSPPARATVAVKSLPLDVLVEIECIAAKDKS
ncbi:MAG: Rid family detoxifying hydrolase [Cyclobacteriaceae bacterium]